MFSLVKRFPQELLIPFTLFLAVTLPYLSYQPFWDGFIVSHCVDAAVKVPFSILNFRCTSHQSIAYLLLLALPQYIQRSFTLMFLTNIALAMASMAAFYGILRASVKTAGLMWEMLLATALFGLSPVFVAHIFHVTLDFGLVSFFVLFLYFLMKERYLWASVFGAAVCLTKETGVVLFVGILCSFWALRAILMRTSKPSQKIPWRSILLSSLPLAVLAAYYLGLFLTGNRLIWNYGSQHIDFATILFDLNIFERTMFAYLTNIFVLNFMWIPGILSLMLILALPRKWGDLKRNIRTDYFFAILLFLAVAGYTVTRYRNVDIPRYVLPVYPLLWVLFFWSSVTLIRSRLLRLSLFSATLLCILISNFRTIDPLSMKLRGTYLFGDHPVLNMNHFYGFVNKDHAFYNLEMTHLYYLVKEAYADLRPARNALFVVGYKGKSTWFPAAPLFPISMIDEVQAPTLSQIMTKVDAGLPPSLRNTDRFIYFFEFPNFKNEENMALLQDQFPLERTRVYDIGGYRITVYVFHAPPQISLTPNPIPHRSSTC
jgi:hypothetical protein